MTSLHGNTANPTKNFSGLALEMRILCAEERWGSGVVKQFSLDMRNAFPNETGFSYSNVKYMKQWYSFYFNGLAAQLKVSEKSHQAGGQLEMPEIFGRVPHCCRIEKQKI